MRKIILFLIIAAFTVNGMAQEECAFVLEEAQELFDAGLIETIPDKLSACLKSGFTNEEQLQAHKLIILSYLFNDDLELADGAMLRFLTEYPAYEPVATDPREFILLMETYDTSPVLMLGGGGGINFSVPIMSEEFGVYNVINQSARLVPGRTGFHGSFRVERQLIPNLHLLGELGIASIVYDNYLNDDSETIVPKAEITDYASIQYFESQLQFRVPVSAAYYFMESDFRPFVRAGIVPGLLLSARAEAQTITTKPDPVDASNILTSVYDVPSIDIMPIRKMINVWVFAGGGFNYKLGPGNLILDLRYHLNVLDQVNPDSNPFQIQELSWEAFYAGDSFFLNNVTATVGYMLPLYRPKKKDQ